jgi:uncharacterized protein YbbK (DUF523 family)
MADPEAILRDAKVVLCSSCLLGEACRFDGRDKLSPKVKLAIAGKKVIPICPEVAGGLGVPRPACSLSGGDGDGVLDGRARVRSADHSDVTAQFEAGAKAAIEAARASGAVVAILQERSPSCGCKQVWIGDSIASGRGVTAAALVREGLTVLSSDDLEKS